MKTLELKLKKDVLIVDLPIDAKNVYMSGNSIIYNSDKSCIVKPINDDYEFICKGSELTEEIASELVEEHYMSGVRSYEIYNDYRYNDARWLDNANDSLISAVESKEKFWLENPIDKRLAFLGNVSEIDKQTALQKQKRRWQAAEEKTFKNPLIFVKNE